MPSTKQGMPCPQCPVQKKACLVPGEAYLLLSPTGHALSALYKTTTRHAMYPIRHVMYPIRHASYSMRHALYKIRHTPYKACLIPKEACLIPKKAHPLQRMPHPQQGTPHRWNTIGLPDPQEGTPHPLQRMPHPQQGHASSLEHHSFVFHSTSDSTAHRFFRTFFFFLSTPVFRRRK